MKYSVLVCKFVLLVAGTLLLTSCAKATPEAVHYTLEMKEYAFNPSTLEAKVGQPVIINVINQGALEHELMFGREVKMMDNKPEGYQHDMFAEAGVEPKVTDQGMDAHMDMGAHDDGHSGFMLTLPKTGDQSTITFTPTQEMVGEWEIGCFMQDGVHYTAGMIGKLIVTP